MSISLEDKFNVTWRDAPFSGRVHTMALTQGLSCAEIVAKVPHIHTRRFLQEGVFCINGEPVPRGMWHLVRPKAREDLCVTLHMPIHGGGGAGKDALRLVATIALLIVATAISGGALGPQGLGVLGSSFAAGTIGAQVLAGAITLGGALLLGAFVKPPAAAPEAKRGAQEEVGTAALQGNVLARGEPVPRVVGTVRAFPPMLAQPLVDLDEYDEVIEGVYGLAGPHRLRDIRFGDVLARDIDPSQLEMQVYEATPNEVGGINNDVQLMLHLLGSEGTVDFRDSSDSPKDILAFGEVHIQPRASFVEGSAAFFDGTVDRLTTPSTTSFGIILQDFTLDFEFEFNGAPGTLAYLCGFIDTGFTAPQSSFRISKTAAGVIEVGLSDGSTFTTFTGTTNIDSGHRHFAMFRKDNIFYVTIGGVVEAQAVFGGTFTGSIPQASGDFTIGGGGGGSTSNLWNGWIGAFRYTVGTAWWDGPFTPSVVAYKPELPTLITRYGKTTQPNIALARHKVQRDSPTQETRDRLENQAVPKISIPQAQSVVVKGVGLDEVWIAVAFPGGLFYADEGFEQDWFNAMPFRLRVRPLGGTTWVNLPEVHIHDRRTTGFIRMFVFRWDGAEVIPTREPNVTAPLRKGWRAAYYSVPTQTVNAPVGSGGWTADSFFYDGTGDTYHIAENFGSSGLLNMRLSIERAEFFLDGLIEKGPIEVEIRRGQPYIADKFTYPTYALDINPPADALSNGVFDLFGWAVMGTAAVLVLKQSNLADEVQIVRATAVWNDPPITRHGEFAAIYVKATARSLDSLSVTASGYVADWDGSEWTGLVATSNPAPHYRDVLVGRLNDNRIPVDLVNDEVLVEWRERCALLDFQCNAAFAGLQLQRVLEVISSCGYARPRQSEVWDVAQDRDFTSIPPVQVFTPRNMSNFRWEKAFVRHRPDGLRVKFYDETNLFTEKTIIVPRLGILAANAGRLEELRYEGITNETKAVLKAVYDQQQVIDRFTFYYGVVDAEMLVCRKGDLVVVQHDIIDQFAGYSRVLEVEIEDSTVLSITLDGSVSPTDAFFTIPTEFFTTPTDFFSTNVGVGVRQKNGTVRTFEAEVSENGFVLTPVTDLIDTDIDLLQRECLVTTGKLLKQSRRMLVFNIAPRADLTAELTFVDEAPTLWQFPEPEEVAEGFMRNRIINGDMRLDQRGLGVAHTLTDEVTSYTLDRWRARSADTDGSPFFGAFSVQQVSDSPPAGFSHYLRITTTDDQPAPAVNDTYQIGQPVPHDSIVDFDWGRTSGRKATLSFSVRSSLTGSFSGVILNPFTDLSYVFTYTIPVANQWIRRTISIAAPPTATTFGPSDDIGVHVIFSLGAGSGFSTTSVNQWVSGNFRALTGQTSVVGTLGATWDLTGVQLEPGTATTFEYLPLSMQQEMAYRFTQVFRQSSIANVIGSGIAVSTTVALISVPLPVPLHRLPVNSISFTAEADFEVVRAGPTEIDATSVSLLSPDQSSEHNLELSVIVAAGLTAGEALLLQIDANALVIDAELYG